MPEIMVIAAHPDDEVLGCGGIIARSVRMDEQNVHIVYMSYGLTSRTDNDKLLDFEKEKVKEKSRSAMSVLMGIPKVETKKYMRFFDYPDNKFDTVPLLTIVKSIEEIIEEIKPDCIFTHSQKDLNIDHCITNRAVITATRPMQGKHRVAAIYMFPIPSSTEWTFSAFGSFSPNVFMDVGLFTELKVNALKCYDTEIRDFPHPRSTELVQLMACNMGSIVGMSSAEGFELLRCLI